MAPGDESEPAGHPTSVPRNGDEIIVLDGVYKIFGPQPRGRAFELLRSGMSKDKVQAETGHVVGLDNVSFTVRKGEVFVVMGLSGSGKSTAMRTVNKLIDITADDNRHAAEWIEANRAQVDEWLTAARDAG